MRAVISECGKYRYRLDRDVQLAGPVVAFIGVNPSLANASRNDPTITKEIGFCEVNGWQRLIKGNVFGFISSKVRDLSTASDPVGPLNIGYLNEIIDEADILIPCWGRRSKIPKRLHPQIVFVMSMLQDSGKPVMTFGLTKDGDPGHPLMLPYSTVIQKIS